MSKRQVIREEMIPALIEAVKKREIIWNFGHEDFKVRFEYLSAWKEVSEELNLPEDVIKLKWKNLRDLFKREIRRLKFNSKGKYCGKWRYYKLMSFMYKPEEGCVDDDDDDEDGEEEATVELSVEDDETNPIKFTTAIDPVKCETRDPAYEVYLEDFQDSLAADTIPAKRRKRHSEDDYDTMYLKSLVPFFSQLEPMRKLIARNKIQDILLNELAAQAQSSTSKHYNKSL